MRAQNGKKDEREEWRGRSARSGAGCTAQLTGSLYIPLTQPAQYLQQVMNGAKPCKLSRKKQCNWWLTELAADQ